MSDPQGTQARGGFQDWPIWRRHHTRREWWKTSYTVRARNAKEAQAKVRRKFNGMALSSMSLLASLTQPEPFA